MKNAFAAGDEMALRLAAQDLADWAPSLLRPLNPPIAAGSRAAALRAVLDFPVVPPGYQQDMPACLGLSGRAVPMEELRERALRLAVGSLTSWLPMPRSWPANWSPISRAV